MMENDYITVGAIVMLTGIGALIFISFFPKMPQKIKKWLKVLALCLSLVGVGLITPNAEYKPWSFFMESEFLIALSFILFIFLIFATTDTDNQTKEQEKNEFSKCFYLQAVKSYSTEEQDAADREEN